MDIRNCRNCGNMFQYVGYKICPKCKQLLEEKLQVVKAYLSENSHATVGLVSEECDVSVKQIRQWVKEERLMFAPGVDTGLVCTKCGMPVESGTLCAKCKESLKDALAGSRIMSSAVATPKEGNKSSSAKMHLSRYNK